MDEMKASQEVKATVRAGPEEMKASQEKVKAGIEANQEKMETKMDTAINTVQEDGGHDKGQPGKN
jgi:hypothetical protein